MREKIARPNSQFYQYQSRLDDITTPLSFENHHLKLQIEGMIPDGISGYYYRNGPNQKQVPFSYHHLIDGNGMVHQFKVSDGEVIYSNKWIRTKIFNLEDKFHCGMAGSFLKPFDSHVRAKNLSSRDRTKANTHVLQLFDKVFTFEEGGIPYLLDKNKLATIGIFSEALKYKTTVTGHPKYDVYDKKLYCLNWNVEPHCEPCTFFSINEEGICENYTKVEVPYRAFIHDYAITENFIILPLFPCIADYEKAKADAKAEILEWQPEQGAKVGIMNKQDPRHIKWIDIDVFYSMHTCNAYEVSDKIVLDLVAHDSPPILVHEHYSAGDETVRSQLTRVTIDPKREEASIHNLDGDDILYNFPRIDDKCLGRNYRYIYSCLTKNTKREGMLYNEFLACFDLIEQTKQLYHRGKDWFFNEPVFVPNGANSKVGYVVAIVSSYVQQRSELLFFSANDIASGPIAKALVPHMIPYGFHGSWYSIV